MESNQLYDRIIEAYDNYTNYNKFVESKQKELQDKKKEIALKILESADDEAEIDVIVYDVFLESRLYKNDAYLFFIKLYNMVESYLLLTEVNLLPEEITELCTSLSHTYPKSVFIVEANGEIKEREKGILEKEKKFFKDSGELEVSKAKLKNILSV